MKVAPELCPNTFEKNFEEVFRPAESCEDQISPVPRPAIPWAQACIGAIRRRINDHRNAACNPSLRTRAGAFARAG